ncbi:hypothetical protein HKD37_05G013160 [Glycine soja]
MKNVQKIQQTFQLKIHSDRFSIIYTSSYVQAANTSDFNLEIKSSVYVAEGLDSYNLCLLMLNYLE